METLQKEEGECEPQRGKDVGPCPADKENDTSYKNSIYIRHLVAVGKAQFLTRPYKKAYKKQAREDAVYGTHPHQVHRAWNKYKRIDKHQKQPMQ